MLHTFTLPKCHIIWMAYEWNNKLTMHCWIESKAHLIELNRFGSFPNRPPLILTQYIPLVMQTYNPIIPVIWLYVRLYFHVLSFFCFIAPRVHLHNKQINAHIGLSRIQSWVNSPPPKKNKTNQLILEIYLFVKSFTSFLLRINHRQQISVDELHLMRWQSPNRQRSHLTHKLIMGEHTLTLQQTIMFDARSTNRKLKYRQVQTNLSSVTRDWYSKADLHFHSPQPDVTNMCSGPSLAAFTGINWPLKCYLYLHWWHG